MREVIAVLGLLLLGSAVARADREVPPKLRRALQRAHDAERDRKLGDNEDRLNKGQQLLLEAARQFPGRPEPFFALGVNRCRRAYFAHGEAEDHITYSRARGMEPEKLQRMRAGADLMIDRWLAEAHTYFRKAFELQKRRSGEIDRQQRLLANAFQKFAARQYLKAKRGEPGAIADFRRLMRAGYNEIVCRNHIALCYLDLGAQAYGEQEYEKAQEWWDKALRWARAPWLRQWIYTNKAGAYELDSEYALAEKLLREQIAQEPRSPVHHKNLGLVAGFQNRLREAAYYYRRTRELCARDPGGALAYFHGNAWLRAAEIHGHLLERNGDILRAWRLFREYHARHGADYNFSVAFGRFAANNRRYGLAWRCFQHAADLQPHCTVPFLELMRIAPRVGATREEADRLSAETKERLEKVQERYAGTDEPHMVARVCAGLRDDPRSSAGEGTTLDGGNPFAGDVPAWVRGIAEERQPYEPWTPSADDPVAEAATEGDDAGAKAAPASRAARLGTLAGILVVSVALVGLLFGRRAPA